MSIKERILGKDWEEKTTTEKITRISKVADAATIFAGLLLLGFAPALASAAITASVATYAGAEVIESRAKKNK